MEDKNKCELILEQLQKAIELYNGLNPEKKLSVTIQDERKDVSNIFVCGYNNDCVGLFEKINWSINDIFGLFDAGSVYVGIDSDYIGMKTTHKNSDCVSVWEKSGTKVLINGRDYIANCNMKNDMSFDDMRLKMYREGKIESYTIGKANSKEILDVLNYAYDYYQLDQNVQRPKVK